MELLVKKLTPTALLPTRGSAAAACYDLRADVSEPVMIVPGGTVKIGTGLAIAIPAGYFGAVYARSGLASKQGLAPANKVGVIDADYRGEWIVALHNHGAEPQIVRPGDRIAQFNILPVLDIEFNEVNELDSTARGEGGFCSTGLQ